mmetsp:Transcript_23931/g.65209  ORF Transcript_23931/g.65209 Transcript_23931/m.65209 type:complete len:404 (+) Transcript_23931:823-2034(+)
MLGLAVLRCFCDLGVQVLDALFQGCDLIGKSRDCALGVFDGLSQIRCSQVKLLLGVLVLVQLGFTIRLLLVIACLLLAEQCHHVVNHGNNLLKAHLLPLQGKNQEVQAGVGDLGMGPLLGDEGVQRLLPDLPAACPGLKQRRARQGLLEDLQGIVIVDNLDGLCDGQELVRAGLLNDLPLLLLLGAVLVKVCQELLVLHQRLCGVIQVLLQGLNLNAGLPVSPQLGLYRLRVALDLLFFGGGHGGVVRLCFVLLCLDRCELLFHRVLHLLQDSDDLPTLRHVSLPLREEGCEHVTVGRAQLHVDRETPHSARCRGLQESCHALLEGCNRLAQCRNIRLVVRGLLQELGRLLRPQARGLGQSILCVRPILLVLRKILLKLVLLRECFVEAACDLRYLCLSLRDR